MQTELEAKWLNINHDDLRKKLMEAGAELTNPKRLMRRKNYDYPDKRLEAKGGWIRVRDEGNKVTLAYKQLNHRGVDGTKEVSVSVSSFNDACLFLESINLALSSYQETYRESWNLNGVEIELDEWPWIKPFLEIEAPNEAALFKVATQLGLSKDDALHGSVEIAYQSEYDVTEAEVDSWPEIVFSEVPDWLNLKRIQK